jgi:hypothetical protein
MVKRTRADHVNKVFKYIYSFLNKLDHFIIEKKYIGALKGASLLKYYGNLPHKILLRSVYWGRIHNTFFLSNLRIEQIS